MRRVKQLINDIRFNSNQTDTNRFSDLRLLKLFNDAQRQIQSIMFMADTDASVFDKETTQNLVKDQEEYTLPSDIFAINSVNSIGIASDDVITSDREVYVPLRKLSIKERRSGWGYILSGNKYLLTPVPEVSVTNGIRINYVQKLPTLSFRLAKISSLTSGSSISLGSGFPTTDITDFDDYVTVVDKDGAIINSGILVNSYNTSTGEISTSDSLDNVSTDHYVVLGKRATSHPDLPDVAEALLTTFVERKIDAIDSSKNIANSDVYNKEEKNNIISLFEKKEHDVKYPVIVNSMYLNV